MVHRDAAEDPPNITAMRVIRRLMHGDHPFMESHDFAVIEDTSREISRPFFCTLLRRSKNGWRLLLWWDHSGDITLDFYRGGLRMVFEQGRLRCAESWRAPLYSSNAMFLTLCSPTVSQTVCPLSLQYLTIPPPIKRVCSREREN